MQVELEHVFQINLEDHKNIPLQYSKIQKNWETWITSACYAAYSYRRDVHYIVMEDQNDQRVVKLLNIDTGMIQENMRLQDGLHEFIERKEGLRMGRETCACFFKSCFTFFNGYDNIIGLTGTLGSRNYIKFFESVYGARSFIIPPFKDCLFQNEDITFCKDEKEWKQEIYQDILRKCNVKRSVLVIFKTIKELKQFKTFLQTNKIRYPVLEYLYSDDEEISEIVKSISPQKIILSTNLGGRGTDFCLTKSLVKQGGMHVILTFYTENSRVLRQAFGRVARKGEPGTGRMILDVKRNPKVFIQQLKTLQRQPDSNKQRKPIFSLTCLNQFESKSEEKMLRKIKIDIDLKYTLMENFLSKFIKWLHKNSHELKRSLLLDPAKYMFSQSVNDLKDYAQNQIEEYTKYSRANIEYYKQKIQEKSDIYFSSFLKKFEELKQTLNLLAIDPYIAVKFIFIHFEKFGVKSEQMTDLTQKIIKHYPLNIQARLLLLKLQNNRSKRTIWNEILQILQKNMETYKTLYTSFIEVSKCRTVQREKTSSFNYRRKKIQNSNPLAQDYLFHLFQDKNKQVKFFKGGYLNEIYNEWANHYLLYKLFCFFKNKRISLRFNSLILNQNYESIYKFFYYPEIHLYRFERYREELDLVVNFLKFQKFSYNIESSLPSFEKIQKKFLSTKSKHIDQNPYMISRIKELESKLITDFCKQQKEIDLFFKKLFCKFLLTYYLRKKEFKYISLKTLEKTFEKAFNIFYKQIVLKFLDHDNWFLQEMIHFSLIERRLYKKDIQKVSDDLLVKLNEKEDYLKLKSYNQFDLSQKLVWGLLFPEKKDRNLEFANYFYDFFLEDFFTDLKRYEIRLHEKDIRYIFKSLAKTVQNVFFNGLKRSSQQAISLEQFSSLIMLFEEKKIKNVFKYFLNKSIIPFVTTCLSFRENLKSFLSKIEIRDLLLSNMYKSLTLMD